MSTISSSLVRWKILANLSVSLAGVVLFFSNSHEDILYKNVRD
jgi:hypothetical protein